MHPPPLHPLPCIALYACPHNAHAPQVPMFDMDTLSKMPLMPVHLILLSPTCYLYQYILSNLYMLSRPVYLINLCVEPILSHSIVCFTHNHTCLLIYTIFHTSCPCSVHKSSLQFTNLYKPKQPIFFWIGSGLGLEIFLNQTDSIRKNLL